MAAPPTVTQIKEHFVANQVLQLSSSTALRPSPAFQAANDQADQALDARHIQSAVASVESAVQAHCRRIYVPQANRAVAEQISDTYTKEAERKLRRDGDGDDTADVETGIGKEIDLADPKTITSLPATWPSERDTTAHPMEAKRYTDAVQALIALQAEREEIKLRVQRLRRLQAIVDPLKTTSPSTGADDGNDSGSSVQDNIVTRGGAMEKELERMRMLLVRVVGRVGMLPEPNTEGSKEGEVESSKVVRKRDLDSFLADSKVFPRT